MNNRSRIILPFVIIVFFLSSFAFSSEGSIQSESKFTGEPFSFDFKDIDVKDLFRFIADISGLNVVLDPSVRGTVTLKLVDVPWDQALDLITKNQGWGYTIEGNVIRVAPLSTISQELKAERELKNQKLLYSQPLVTKIIKLSYARAENVMAIVQKLLTSRGSVIAEPRMNLLIITDVESNIGAILQATGE